MSRKDHETGLPQSVKATTQLVPTEPFPHARPPRAEIRELGDGAKIALDIELLQHGRYAMQMDDGHLGLMSDMEISQPIGDADLACNNMENAT